MTLIELREALQRATEPDSRLDAELHLKLKPQVTTTAVTREQMFGPYTGSVDAAMTLVPEGAWWMFGKGKIDPYEPLFGAVFYEQGTDKQLGLGGEHDYGLPFALCLARVEYEIAKADKP